LTVPYEDAPALRVTDIAAFIVLPTWPLAPIVILEDFDSILPVIVASAPSATSLPPPR
jgi:hypothetical protein